MLRAAPVAAQMRLPFGGHQQGRVRVEGRRGVHRADIAEPVPPRKRPAFEADMMQVRDFRAAGRQKGRLAA